MMHRINCPRPGAPVDVGDASGKGGNRADWTGKCLVMYDRAFGAIFRVSNTNGGAVSSEEGGQARCVR